MGQTVHSVLTVPWLLASVGASVYRKDEGGRELGWGKDLVNKNVLSERDPAPASAVASCQQQPTLGTLPVRLSFQGLCPARARKPSRPPVSFVTVVTGKITMVVLIGPALCHVSLPGVLGGRSGLSVGEDIRGPEGRGDVPRPHGHTCGQDPALPLGPL